MHVRAPARILVQNAHKPSGAHMINEDIRTLLEAPPTGDEAPTLDHIEDTLTSGYARALALEAERWRLERKIADVAARLGEEVTDEDAAELAKLGQRLADADGDLSRLRALLASLRTRADEVRAA
jgi:ABC-type phosphate transport system auxiliary subunit